MRRRFQRGTFVEEAGRWYSMWYESNEGRSTKRVKRLIGRCSEMSERAARRAHAIQMDKVNEDRESLAPIMEGQSFAEAVENWRRAVAPNLSPATVRARESHLRAHVTPRFGDAALSEIGVHQLQQFATDLRKTVSRKTVVHILTTIFGVVHYAKRCGITVNKVAFADLELGTRGAATVVPFFTREQATQIVEAAKQPHKTLFALAWFTGLRSGELLALTVDDLNVNDHTIRVNKSADDLTQAVRQPKTKCSVAMLPKPSELESVLRNYLDSHWQPNEGRKDLVSGQVRNARKVTSQRRGTRFASGTSEARNTNAQCWPSRFSPRPSDGVSRSERADFRTANTDATQRRFDNSAPLHSRNATESSRGNGRRRASIGTN
jgi:integrase